MQAEWNTMRLCVEYTYDPESRNWCFVVPSHHIIGGAKSRKEAERRAAEALLFTIESDDQEDFPLQGDVAEALPEPEIGYLEVTVRPVPGVGSGAEAQGRKRRQPSPASTRFHLLLGAYEQTPAERDRESGDDRVPPSGKPPNTLWNRVPASP